MKNSMGLKKILAVVIVASMMAINVALPQTAATASADNHKLVIGQVSKAFTNYINSKGSRKNGLVPLPMQYPKNTISSSKSLKASTLPSKYDLRTLNRVTSVKDQGQIGSCWTFGTFGSLESWNLTAGNGTQDYSENNLMTHDGFDLGVDDGGNSYMSTAYLARWDGPCNESDDPYASPAYPQYVVTRNNVPVRQHVQDVIFIPQRANALDNDDTKNALMQYGALYTAVNFNESYYNSTTDALYESQTPSDSITANHAVTIVGWDDTYSKSNFKTTPAGDGAFIIKNSWGSSWGNHSGYFYVSYYDNFLGCETAAFINGQSTTNYSKQYQYDPLGFVDQIGFNSNTAWFANVFAADTNSQNLSAVSFYTTQKNAAYTVYVEPNYDTNKFTNLTQVTTGTIAMPGYHTINLPSAVALNAGKNFAVVVKLVTPNETKPIAIEEVYNQYSSKATASTGQSFTSADGQSWTDLMVSQPSLKANVCLKAFTTYTGTPTPTAPTVTSTTPVNGATNVDTTTAITATFSAAIQQGTSFSTISVKDSAGTALTVTPTISGSTLTIGTALSQGKTYTVTIPKGAVTDTSNNALAQDYTFSFTTKAATPSLDSYEPNDSMTQAYQIVSGTSYKALIGSSTDVDYFKIVVTKAGTVSISLSTLPKDYDLYLINSSGTAVAKSERSGTSSESISYRASKAGTYYIKVKGYNSAYSATSQYTLKATFQ